MVQNKTNKQTIQFPVVKGLLFNFFKFLFKLVTVFLKR